VVVLRRRQQFDPVSLRVSFKESYMSEPIYDTRTMVQLSLATHFSEEEKASMQGRVHFESFPREEMEALLKLEERVVEFREQVWEAGLQKIVDACRYKGMEGRVSETIEILCYSMAGRTMTTLREGDHDVTVLSASNEAPSRMGLHGINGTLRQGQELLQRACEVWKTQGISMEHEKSVTLDVLTLL
jgi:hypothetical protein